jgi:hypothetical protein
MSSSNLVKISSIEETVYGVTPATGDFKTVRYTSESLSGTPQTAESAEIQSDRTSGGQVQVGLDVGGDINAELSADLALNDFIRGAMMQASWFPGAIDSGDWTVDPIGKTFTSDTTALTIKVGDLFIVSDATETKNNGPMYVTAVDTETTPGTTVLTVAKETIASESGPMTLRRSDRLSVGTDTVSFSIEKDFTDLTDKAIAYRGMLVNQMNLSMTYGSIVESSFMFMGNGYETPVPKITSGRTITPAGTTQPFNASSDIGLVIVEGEVADFCIQSLQISLSNGLTPQTCMGTLAPRQYALGMAAITVSGSAYLSDENWDLMAKKLSQTPVSIAFSVENDDGGMAFVIHGAQLSFPDPSSGGMDQQVSIEFSGAAKAVESGYFDIYKF